MDVCQKIEHQIMPSLTDLGYEIVRITLQGGDVKTIQIMAERSDRVNMTLGDCQKISRTVSALLEVEDPFQGKYTLEVSSPGVDRPLVRESDYTRFKGSDAKLETVHEIDGRKRFKGKILDFNPETHLIEFEFENQKMMLLFSDIAKAKLLLSETVIEKQPKK